MTNLNMKKLIEVAIPLEAINTASVKEKSIRQGHPSTLHLWWARRPLAACRAVLFAQLVDDPSSHPDRFPTEVAVENERKRLFSIIQELVKWKNTTNEEVLERARDEIRKSCGDVLPPVFDPFSGGGSIPLEAQRLGLPAHGSDLNPVAVMIGKAMIEVPPMFKDMKPVHPDIKNRTIYRKAEGLAEDIEYYGNWMRERAYERIGHIYPKLTLPKEHGGGIATVVAWFWTRTVPSPDPAYSNVQVPITSSFLLCSKKKRKTWIEPIIDKSAKTITYNIRKGGTKEELAIAKSGTQVGRGANFRCIMSEAAITPDYVRQIAQDGRMEQSLMAIAAEGEHGRIYVPPSPEHEGISNSALPDWKPEGDMNQSCPDLVSGRGYGFKHWWQLFTNRQLIALKTFGDLVFEAREQILTDALAAGLSTDSTSLCNNNCNGGGAKHMLRL